MVTISLVDFFSIITALIQLIYLSCCETQITVLGIVLITTTFLNMQPTVHHYIAL